MTFSPDGRVLAAGTGDGTVWLWHLTAPAHPTGLGQLVTGSAGSVSVAFSPHGQILAAGSDTGSVWLLNLTNPAHPTRLG